MAIRAEFHGGPKDGLVQELDYMHYSYKFPGLKGVKVLHGENDLESRLVIHEYDMYKWDSRDRIAHYRYLGER